MLGPSFYNQDSVTAAPALLGCELIFTPERGDPVGGLIVETEAYRQDDEASHSFRGKTKRNAVMFGPGGHAYVYFTYGAHYCFNVVFGQDGFAEGVLIRALKPTRGIEIMERRRRTAIPHNLCSGPGKLVQALGLGLEHNGTSLLTPQLHILPRTTQPAIAAGPRIGISRATDKPWRFMVAGSPWITKHKFNSSAYAGLI